MQTVLPVLCTALALTVCLAQPAPVPPPPIPSGVKCGGSGGAAAAGVHQLSWAPLASADVYEVEVGLSEASAVHTPLASTTTATPTVSFAGLDATQTWWFKVRAHAKAGTGIGTDVEWSDFSAPITCKAGPAELPAKLVERGAGSRYTRMYRVSEVWGGRLWGREYAPPDFLSSCVPPLRVSAPYALAVHPASLIQRRRWRAGTTPPMLRGSPRS
jgi:hypothetical protein